MEYIPKLNSSIFSNLGKYSLSSWTNLWKNIVIKMIILASVIMLQVGKYCIIGSFVIIKEPLIGNYLSYLFHIALLVQFCLY
jgi:hypothetical protein